MPLQPAFILRDSIEHARHAVADVVAHYVAYVQCRKYYSDGRQEYIYVVAGFEIDAGCENLRYIVYEPFEGNGCQTGEYAHYQG